MRPPMRACDDDDGRPKYQVTRFHVIAPNSAANTTTMPELLLSCSGSRMPLPTVFATSVDTSAPARLATAASPSATRGVRARVDTAVAMALAASWKPFVQSKASAIRTTAISPTSMADTGLGLLDGDRLDRVRDVLERVGRGLE